MKLHATLTFFTAAALLTGALLFFAGCEKEKNGTYISNVKFTDCYSDFHIAKSNVYDSIVIRCKDNSLYIEHHNYLVPCGFNFISVKHYFYHDTLSIVELPVPNYDNNCICEISNAFRINNIPHGKYVLVMGNYPYYVCYEKKIEI